MSWVLILLITFSPAQTILTSAFLQQMQLLNLMLSEQCDVILRKLRQMNHLVTLVAFELRFAQQRRAESGGSFDKHIVYKPNGCSFDPTYNYVLPQLPLFHLQRRHRVFQCCSYTLKTHRQQRNAQRDGTRRYKSPPGHVDAVGEILQPTL